MNRFLTFDPSHMSPAPQFRSCSLWMPLLCSTITSAPAGPTPASSRQPKKKRKWWEGRDESNLTRKCFVTEKVSRFVLLLSECVGVGWSRLSGPQDILHFLHGEFPRAQNRHFSETPCSMNTNSDGLFHIVSRADKETNENEPLLPVWRLRGEAGSPLRLDQRLHRYGKRSGRYDYMCDLFEEQSSKSVSFRTQRFQQNAQNCEIGPSVGQIIFI